MGTANRVHERGDSSEATSKGGQQRGDSKEGTARRGQQRGDSKEGTAMGGQQTGDSTLLIPPHRKCPLLEEAPLYSLKKEHFLSI